MYYIMWAVAIIFLGLGAYGLNLKIIELEERIKKLEGKIK